MGDNRSKKIIKRNERVQSEIDKIIHFINENKLEEAKEILEYQIKNDPDNVHLMLLMGVYYIKKSNFRSAISYLLRVIDSPIGNIYMPAAVKLIVFSYIKTGNNELAKALIKDAIQTYYDDIHLKNMLAYIYYTEKNYVEASKIYKEVLSKNPDNITALNGLGYCMIEHFSKHHEGLKLCLKALEKDPFDPSILDSVGWGYFKIGEYKKAEEYLKKAFQIAPENEDIKKHITIVVEKT
ncbi:MAG TPA: tetratricopeptide repeat protein [Spirochaetota bacterium]|mgnify:CR=1 FL=1|nr:tetratricopeptide repeat protein [Spirochaetota bacterium]HOM38971.1 tetratricopeptide repeat protein [Spirochaetota bacterium]HPQ48369.1 tetratricopeptide repeat protein [Spirochaetota bacterium]